MSRLGQDAEIPSYSKKSRMSSAQVATKEKAKAPKTPKVVKQVNVDVFIPSVVTVGNLARLLNISLGMSCIKVLVIPCPMNCVRKIPCAAG